MTAHSASVAALQKPRCVAGELSVSPAQRRGQASAICAVGVVQVAVRAVHELPICRDIDKERLAVAVAEGAACALVAREEPQADRILRGVIRVGRAAPPCSSRGGLDQLLADVSALWPVCVLMEPLASTSPTTPSGRQVVHHVRNDV